MPIKQGAILASEPLKLKFLLVQHNCNVHIQPNDIKRVLTQVDTNRENLGLRDDM
jgi:hypothetical protein